MSRAPAAAQRGMTLVELILFIVIAAVVAAAMVQAFSGTMRGSHFGKEMTQATQLAQQRMEIIDGQFKFLSYANVDAANYDPCQLAIPPWPASEACGTTAYPAGSFAVASTAPVADACGVGCTEVTVAVTGPYGDAVASVTRRFWNVD